MLIKSATHTPNKSPYPIQGNEDQSFKGKRLPKPQKAAKLVARHTPSPRPASADLSPTPGPQRPCLSNREPVIPRWMPDLQVGNLVDVRRVVAVQHTQGLG